MGLCTIYTVIYKIHCPCYACVKDFYEIVLFMCNRIDVMQIHVQCNELILKQHNIKISVEQPPPSPSLTANGGRLPPTCLNLSMPPPWWGQKPGTNSGVLLQCTGTNKRVSTICSCPVLFPYLLFVSLLR